MLLRPRRRSRNRPRRLLSPGAVKLSDFLPCATRYQCAAAATPNRRLFAGDPLPASPNPVKAHQRVALDAVVLPRPSLAGRAPLPRRIRPPSASPV